MIFIKNPNLIKQEKILKVEEDGVGVAKVSDFFSKKFKSEKNVFFLRG